MSIFLVVLLSWCINLSASDSSSPQLTRREQRLLQSFIDDTLKELGKASRRSSKWPPIKTLPTIEPDLKRALQDSESALRDLNPPLMLALCNCCSHFCDFKLKNIFNGSAVSDHRYVNRRNSECRKGKASKILVLLKTVWPEGEGDRKCPFCPILISSDPRGYVKHFNDQHLGLIEGLMIDPYLIVYYPDNHQKAVAPE